MDKDVILAGLRPGRPWVLILLFCLSLLIAACKPAFLDPPRLATATARAELLQSPTPAAPLNLPAPTPTADPLETAGPAPAGAANPRLTFWGKQGNAAENAAQQAIIADFNAQHDINAELFLVEAELLPGLINTAVISDDYPLPDVLLMPMEFVVGWAETGILDPAAAAGVLAELDPATFDATALQLVEVNGTPAALPSDGWQQLLLYRRDWFEERNLAPPISYSTMISAGQAISDSVALIAGFNMPTESSLVATTRVFEQFALANGCHLVDEKGELLILQPACQEALEFYRQMCNRFCPPGVQTEVSTRNAYLSGRAGMIMAPPSILPMLAGLDPANQPNCPDCTTADYLARNTGIATSISGNAPGATPAHFGNATYLGVTSAANREAAAAFLRYWFNEGYETWLAARPEMKVPLRQGTPDEPQRFLEFWRATPLTAGGPTMSDLYSEEVVTDLSTGILNESRWALARGHGGLLTRIYDNLLFSILLQELLSGYYNSERAAIEGYKRLVEIIPDYPYYVDPEPTPTP